MILVFAKNLIVVLQFSHLNTKNGCYAEKSIKKTYCMTYSVCHIFAPNVSFLLKLASINQNVSINKHVIVYQIEIIIDE